MSLLESGILLKAKEITVSRPTHVGTKAPCLSLHHMLSYVLSLFFFPLPQMSVFYVKNALQYFFDNLTI